MKEKKFNEQFPSIAQTQVLTDEMMEKIESGACDSGCKKACLSTPKTEVDVEVEM